MFAHQVIEDKKKYFNKEIIPVEQEFGEATCTLKNPNIADAVCFSLPEFHELLELTKIPIDGTMDMTEIDPQYLKLPYQKVWIDGYYSEEYFKNKTPQEEREIEVGTCKQTFCDKWGMLIVNMGKQGEMEYLSIISYYHSKKYNVWNMEPYWWILGISDNKVNTKRAWLQIYDNIDIETRIKILGNGSADGLYVTIAFLKLINCKNITTELIKAPTALNKKRKRNGKQELFDYHILKVLIPNNKQEYQLKTESNYHVKIHLCRGHFKKYTPEHPLFGKYTGLYWWQPQARGNKKLGVVMKDYVVKQAV